MNKKVVLCILDGWGIEQSEMFNAIHEAKHWPSVLKKYPHTILQASEQHVGLPEGQMGNSEVGHTTIGLGRIIMQDLPKIDHNFSSGLIRENAKITDIIEKLKRTNKPCHIMGLLSSGGVHSHISHIVNAAKILDNAGIKVYVHGFLDGRDTPPKSAETFVSEFLKETVSHKNIHLASLGGRYYGMDRDNRWDRIELAYDAIISGIAPKFTSALEAIKKSYDADITDEFLIPTIHQDYHGINDGEGLWMINFRSDRVRQILRSFLVDDFAHFERKKIITFGPTLAMNEYSKDLNELIPSLFSKDAVDNSLGEVIANHGLKQLRIAETEKYAHVTFFLNGGQEAPFNGEERFMIPSPSVTTYDLQPEMSAKEVTKKVTEAMDRDDLSLIVVNYANTDMVGHTGVIDAIIKAVDFVDGCIKIIEEKALEKAWTLLITADHGNAECMREDDKITPHTAHTCNPVPFVMINGEADSLNPGSLADVAPTILDIIGLAQPKEMTGKSLLCSKL